MSTYNDLVTRFSFEGSTAPLVNFNQLTETMTEALSESQRQFAELAKSLSGANDEFNEAAGGVDRLDNEIEHANRNIERFGESADDASRQVEQADEATFGFKATLAATSAVISGIVAATASWVGSIADGIDPLVQMSRVTGESIEDLQAWGYAASQNGSSVEAVSESMREMNMRMGEFARSGGGPAAEVFKQFGINVRDANGDVITAGHLMGVLNEKMQTLSEGERLDLLDKVGADKSLVQLLGSSSEQMDSLVKKAKLLGVTTKEEADQFAAYNDSLTTTKFGASSLAKTMALGVLPTLKGLSDSLTEFMIDNREWLKETANNVGEFFGAVIESLTRMTPVLVTAAAAMTTYWFATSGAALATKALMSPITLIVGAIAGLYLVIDDLIVALDGGQSVIRDFFLNNFDFDIVPLLENIIAGFKSLFSYFEGMLSPIFDVFKGVFDLIWSTITLDGKGAADAIDDIFSGLGEYIYNVFIKLPKDIFSLFSTEGESFFDGFLSFAKAAIDKLWTFFTDLFDGLFGGLPDIAFTGLSKLIELIKSKFTSVKNWIVGFFDFDLFGGIAESAKSIGSGIANTASDAYGFVAENAGKVADKVSGFFSGLFDGDGEKETLKQIGDFGTETFSAIASTAKSAFYAPGKAIDKIFSGTFDDVYDSAMSSFNEISSGAIAGIKDLSGLIFDSFKSSFSLAADFALDSFLSVFDKIKSLFNQLKDGLLSMVPDFMIPDSMTAKIDMSAIEQARAKTESQVISQPSYNNVQTTSQEATVNVYTSDPVEAGNQVADQLNGQLASARYGAARGGM